MALRRVASNPTQLDPNNSPRPFKYSRIPPTAQNRRGTDARTKSEIFINRQSNREGFATLHRHRAWQDGKEWGNQWSSFSFPRFLACIARLRALPVPQRFETSSFRDQITHLESCLDSGNYLGPHALISAPHQGTTAMKALWRGRGKGRKGERKRWKKSDGTTTKRRI